MAVEDAVALAECLSLAEASSNGENHDTNSPNLHAALSLFESLRKPRAEAVQKASLHAGNLLHLPPGPAREKRDAALMADGAVRDEDAEYAYGIADRKTRDWCYGYDAAEEVRKEWQNRFR